MRHWPALLVPLAAAGYIAVDAEDGMWEIDLTSLTRVALDSRMHGVTPAGLKVAGFVAALARVQTRWRRLSLLGLRTLPWRSTDLVADGQSFHCPVEFVCQTCR